jgi:hypothetical protein
MSNTKKPAKRLEDLGAGWIKIHREIMDYELYHAEPFTYLSAWIDLLLIANHKPGYIIVRGIKIEIPRGHVGHSETTLSKRWKWSRGKVRRYLDFMQNSVHQIEQKKTGVINLISILNYDLYQAGGPQTLPQTVQQTDTNKNTLTINSKSIYSEELQKEFSIFLAWLKKNAPRVGKMSEPITIDQYQEVRQLKKEAVAKTLRAMQNYKPLTSKNVSAYLTLINWIKRDEERDKAIGNKPAPLAPAPPVKSLEDTISKYL